MNKKTENFCIYWLTIFFKCMFWLYEHPFTTVILNCFFITVILTALFHQIYIVCIQFLAVYTVLVIMIMIVMDLEAQQRDSLRHQVFNYVCDRSP